MSEQDNNSRHNNTATQTSRTNNNKAFSNPESTIPPTLVPDIPMPPIVPTPTPVPPPVPLHRDPVPYTPPPTPVPVGQPPEPTPLPPTPVLPTTPPINPVPPPTMPPVTSAGIVIRNGEGTTAKGRDASRDHHDEIQGGVTHSSLISSAVGDVRLNGVSYNVDVTHGSRGMGGEYNYVGVSTSQDPYNNIISKGPEQISEALKKQVDTALSKASPGGTALTYNEARKILINVLPDATNPERGGRLVPQEHDGTNPNKHLQGNAPAAGRGAGGRGDQ